MLQPAPTALSVWPADPADVAELKDIIWAQMATVAENAELIDRYQTVLNNAQAIPPAAPALPAQAALTGTSGSASVTLAGVSGTVVVGALVEPTTTNAAIPAGATILSQTSGTPGGNGVYTLSANLTAAITTAVPVTVTPQPPPATSPWPFVTAATDLNDVMAAQTLVLRTQTSLIQQYQDLLNISDTPVPA